MIQRPYLLDTTRLISRSWTRRRSTGIDRVSYAYLEHFGARAQAVVQHRGVVRVLTPRHSDRLFDMLRGPDGAFRRKLMAFGPHAMAAGASRIDADGAIYINTSHTDFDLPGHGRWAARSRLRPVYLIHDLIPITHSQYCRNRAVTRHRGRVTNALRNAGGIIVNSETTARELAAFSSREGLPLPPVLTALLAGASLPKAAMATSDSGAYFMGVGTIEPRKNHMLLLWIWQRLIEEMGGRAPRLVIVGQWGVNSEPVRAMLAGSPALRRHVTVMTDCLDEDLGRWIAGARALLMPTLAEGFGLPLVEALNLGTPVIASDLPCFRETGQGIPTFLDPSEPDAWLRLIRSFDDHPERARQLASMSAYVAPSWERHFAAVEAWFASLPPLSPIRAEARPQPDGPSRQKPLRAKIGLPNALAD